VAKTLVTIRRAGVSLPNHHPFATENKQTRSFLVVAACLSPPSPLHHQKQAHLLVFDGVCFFSTTTTTPLPPKMSKHAHFQWWLLVCHPFTIENERICSFSMVLLVYYHPHPSSPSKTSIGARSQGI